MADTTTASPPSPPPQGATNWRAKYDEQVEKNELSYEQNVAFERQVQDLQDSLDALSRDLREAERARQKAEQRESELREESEKQQRELDELRELHTTEKSKRTRLEKELMASQEQAAAAQADSEKNAVDAVTWGYELEVLKDNMKEKDALLAGADEKQTELEDQLQSAQDQIAEAQKSTALMEAINDTLEAEFSRLGKDLTPTELQSYLDDLLSKSRMTRHDSEISIDSAFANSPSQPLPKGKGGVRKISLHEELEQLDDDEFEDDTPVEYVDKMTMTDLTPAQYIDSNTMTDDIPQPTTIEPTVPQPVITEPIIKHHYHAAQPFQALKNFWDSIPFIIKLLLAFILTLLAIKVYGIWHEHRLWRIANTLPASYFTSVGSFGFPGGAFVGEFGRLNTGMYGPHG